MTPTDRCFILSFDQGTTSSRAIVFDHTGTVISLAQQEFPQLYPAPGLVEHDPEAIWSSQLAVARAAISQAGISAAVITAIGITNQRETTVVWEKQTGRPVYMSRTIAAPSNNKSRMNTLNTFKWMMV